MKGRKSEKESWRHVEGERQAEAVPATGHPALEEKKRKNIASSRERGR